MPISEQTKMFRKVPGSFSECSWIILRYLIKYINEAFFNAAELTQGYNVIDVGSQEKI